MKNLVELGVADDSTPCLAVSILRGRMKAVTHSGTQIGIASDFDLAQLDDRIGLVCRVELNEDALEEIKPLLADGEQMEIAGHPVIAVVGP